MDQYRYQVPGDANSRVRRVSLPHFELANVPVMYFLSMSLHCYLSRTEPDTRMPDIEHHHARYGSTGHIIYHEHADPGPARSVRDLVRPWTIRQVRLPVSATWVCL